ncbi:uncharacterized protein DUF904 [Sinobacterium caligoides]|uniref:Uncharacterized protein DUF904 n=1 Tax=Sinobacterium caligoides TaxID=933926 RepID=A0A3N2DQA4_9GAMM|nr:cell division protein ZapB [Sinobacterium caligoides]ROS01862.1 uncharacterized protein DUF904 [Sinobacterium caligoides]
MMQLLDDLEKKIILSKETIELLEMETAELREELAEAKAIAEENLVLKANQAKWEERLGNLMRHFKESSDAPA